MRGHVQTLRRRMPPHAGIEHRVRTKRRTASYKPDAALERRRRTDVRPVRLAADVCMPHVQVQVVGMGGVVVGAEGRIEDFACAIAHLMQEARIVVPCIPVSGHRNMPSILQGEAGHIEHYGSFACRNIYPRQDGPLSEHARANALDVAGFTLQDGRHI
ncbi:MAG: extensin family protein, partial [Zoogloea sp.]|nr:extensin family protein [Zoogloea sp.]